MELTKKVMENEHCYGMTIEDFGDYIKENFNLDGGSAHRLIRNILDYADCHFTGDDLYFFLSKMFDNTIGLSDEEIRKVSN